MNINEFYKIIELLNIESNYVKNFGLKLVKAVADTEAIQP